MKNYRVIVDGVEYEIGIEPMDSADLKTNSVSKPQHDKSVTQTANPSPQNAQGAGEAIRSPMPGEILSVRAQAGQAVKKGEVLMILEAMKMENEIIAPRDATITSVNVQNGTAVQTGTVLCNLQ